jgi:hypothetical protein
MNIIYEDRELEGEQLELADKEGIYFLGPNLTLRRCTLVLRVPARWLHILPTRFIDCTLQVKQELKNHDWSRAFLKGCRFTGPLMGCDFGHRLPLDRPGRENGGIEDCDFTGARLNYCRFHGCDMRTIRLPPWPCFTLLDPIGRSRELNSVKWPERFGGVIVENLHTEPASTVAVSYHAPTVAKRYGTTPEELKAVLEKLDCVVY